MTCKNKHLLDFLHVLLTHITFLNYNVNYLNNLYNIFFNHIIMLHLIIKIYYIHNYT